MAEKKDIYSMYCAIAIARLQQEGLIIGDRDWDCNGSKYTIRLYNQAGRSNTDLIVIHDKSYKTISVIDTATEEEMKYDFVPEDRDNRVKFAEVVINYAKKKA